MLGMSLGASGCRNVGQLRLGMADEIGCELPSSQSTTIAIRFPRAYCVLSVFPFIISTSPYNYHHPQHPDLETEAPIGEEACSRSRSQ